jgi:hypothetical protein
MAGRRLEEVPGTPLLYLPERDLATYLSTHFQTSEEEE